MPVLEIADRDKIPFPSFDGVLLPYHQLRDMVDDPRYADWRTALAEVQGIYLITRFQQREAARRQGRRLRTHSRTMDYARNFCFQPPARVRAEHPIIGSEFS
ncbi:hypothetical protein GCM10009784_06460 [Arthrobacter parietis]|uniref:Uncharacterized protein n=1 Tax=Arthrobacter parietis TaxID=271434 RepID=A0ABP5MEZ2_9MICC